MEQTENVFLTTIQERITKRVIRFRYVIDASVTDVDAALAEIISKNLVTGEKYDSNWYADKVATWLCKGCRPWLMLAGNTGNGKTTMAVAVGKLIDALDCEERKDSDGNFHTVGFIDKRENPFMNRNAGKKKVMFTTAQDLCDLAKTNYERYTQLKTARFLIIDDIGIEPVQIKNFGNEMSPIADTLYWRYDRNFFTIMTTNMNTKEIFSRYGERIADRMRSHMDYFGCSSKSYRGGAQWK